MKGKKQRLKIAEIKRNPIRQSNGTSEELMALGRSWLDKAIHDIVVTHSLVCADGHRRLAGLELLGETEAEVLVLDEDLDEEGMLQIGLVTAIHRADLSGWDKYQAVKQLAALNPGMSFKELAALLHVTPATVTHLMAVAKCIPEAKEALKNGPLTVSDCYALSKLPMEDQPALLELKLGGANRETLERHGRKKRAEGKAAPKSGRIKIPLAGGCTVHVVGAEMSLEEAIEAMSDAVKLAKAALAKDITAVSAQSVWKTLAVAGLTGASGLKPAQPTEAKPNAAG